MQQREDYDPTVKLLEHSFAELTIQDQFRKATRMPLPDESVMVQFNLIAKELMCKLSRSFDSHKRGVVAFFGAPTIVIAKLWELIFRNNDCNKRIINNKEHLLWALHYMKQSPSFDVFCKTVKKNRSNASPTKKTALKWVWFYVKEIEALEDVVINWDHRKTNDRGDDCLASIDCIDCEFQQILIDHPTKPGKKIRNKALYSFKFNGPALRYEVALSLLSNDIVWINGPFCPGDWTDLEIFRFNLMHQLEPGERIEADNGYIGEAPRYVVCPACCTTKSEELAVMRRVEGRHEAMNRHIKNWKCMKGIFDVKGTPVEKMEKHGALFWACVIVKQVSMQMGVGEMYDI